VSEREEEGGREGGRCRESCRWAVCEHAGKTNSERSRYTCVGTMKRTQNLSETKADRKKRRTER